MRILEFDEDSKFDKFARSKFEHQRFMLMARRAAHTDVGRNLSRRAIYIKKPHRFLVGLFYVNLPEGLFVAQFEKIVGNTNS